MTSVDQFSGSGHSPQRPTNRLVADVFARMEQHLRDYAAVNTRRAGLVTVVEAEQRASLHFKWAQEWKTVVDPKAVLAQLLPKIGKLRSAADLESALFARARLDPP